MYKALVGIGDYERGDIVPDELAETWAKMYKVSPVEKVKDEEQKTPEPLTEEIREKIEKEVEKSKSGQESSEVTSADLSEDYLGRNSQVVVKNIQTDKLNKEQLRKLLLLEKSNKKRYAVIKALEKKLEENK